MSDDDWAEFTRQKREESKARRAGYRAHAANRLDELGIPYTSHNEGAHLVVRGNNGLIDYWPGTGKFIARNGKKGRGLQGVLKLCSATKP